MVHYNSKFQINTSILQDFNAIYAIITKMNPSENEIDLCESMVNSCIFTTLLIYKQAHQWIKDFVNIKLDGHSKLNITPYMHLMCCHVPSQMKRYNGIKRFSGQGELAITTLACTLCYKLIDVLIIVALSKRKHMYNHFISGVERNNDMARKFYQSSNHKDAPNTVMDTERRIRKLSSKKRKRRGYTRRKTSSKRQRIEEQTFILPTTVLTLSLLVLIPFYRMVNQFINILYT